jgi:hypothetical protein
MDYRLDMRDSIPGSSKNFFSSSSPPDQLWFLSSKRSWRTFLREENGWRVKLATHLHPVAKSRTIEMYLHIPIHLHGVMLN